MTQISVRLMVLAVLALTPSVLHGQTNGADASRALPGRNPYLGSTPASPVSSTSMAISFSDAIQRGLRYNLGLIESVSDSAAARAARLQALAPLLPTITAHAAQVYENLSLKEIGLTLPGLPPVTGGFGFQDLRVGVSQSIFNGELRNRYRSGLAAERASVLSARDARDVVVFAVGAAYVQIVASTARLNTANAQLASARELDRLTADRVKADVAPEIDSLRAQVERQTAEQRGIDAANDLEKNKLTLARIIGLAIEQPFTVDMDAPYRQLSGITEESVKDRALRFRSDLASAQAGIDAAEFDLRAARAQQYPSVRINADYGGGGDRARFNQVYTVSAAVSVPLYTGGRIRGDIARAENELARRRAEYEDLKGRVAYDVRVAWLDLSASGSSVTVAEHNKDLAGRALTEAQDRYANGVTNYLEVVQSQETVVRADENLIASLYAFNVAKLALARAAGNAESGVKELFQ